MALGTAAEEIKKSDNLWNSTDIKALREQQETDFGYWGPYEFEMPKKEGAWDKVTTNSPKILANKIIGLLASSSLQLFIDVDIEKKKGRERISNTERLANGCIWIADREAIAVPSGKRLQAALSTYAVIKGGTAKSLYWWTDDEGKPRCDIRVYDPTFCQWIEGDKELLWFCYRNYVTKEYIEHAYKKKLNEGFSYGSPDTYGRILTYTFWDDEKWKIAINGEYVDEDKHGLGYIPVNVRSCGAVPHILSEKYQDTMKWAWQSYAMNTRNIYDLMSRLLSIMSTKAIDSGRKDIIGEWDSVKAGGETPKLDVLGYGTGQRNNFLLLDTVKGYKFDGFAQAPDNTVTMDMYNKVRGELDIMATIDPVASGIMTRGGSGVYVSELKAATLEFTNPFRECVQDDFIWIAEECVKQFKAGQYDKVSLEGRDRKREKFHIDLKPSDVEEKRFDCNLVPDKLRDKLQELGAAIQQVSYGLTSKRTARLQHNIVDDPDREQDIMDEEEAVRDPVFRYEKMAKYYKDQGEDEMARYYMALAKLVAQQTIQKAVMAELMPPEEMKKPSVISPQMEAERIATEPQGLTDIGV